MANKTVWTTTLDISAWEDDLDRIDHMLYKLTSPLYALLEAQFAQTQAQVHVITASLKLSGSTETDMDKDTWTGTITYGGPSKGVNNPVHYAIYEMKRGGAHDFFSGMDAFHQRYMDVIMAGLQDKL